MLDIKLMAIKIWLSRKGGGLDAGFTGNAYMGCLEI